MILEELSACIAKELHIKKQQSDAVIKLLDEGNTVPFIARYRKEATGELDEEKIRQTEERVAYLRNVIKRQEEILHKIDEQGKLTEELKAAISASIKLQDLEDLYLPYKQKKRTRAQIAKEKGLEPLTLLLLAERKSTKPALEHAAAFVSPEKEILTAEEALAGALDILAENISDRADIRALLRKEIWQTGEIHTEMTGEVTEENQAFLMYAEYHEPIRTLPSHRILAINRGEKKDFLRVKLVCDSQKQLSHILQKVLLPGVVFTAEIEAAAADSYKRLLFPALEREIRSLLTENAEKQAIRVFGLNLRQLLLQAPLAGHTILGLDPGYRTGCKAAIVDATGHVLDHGVLYLTMSDDAREKSTEKVLSWIKKYKITLISIGNGTASYETEEFAARLIREHGLDVHYLITNEAGASVYSASKLAKEELPDYDVTIRGAVSIARRVQDPLAELVKIDPKAIGVGQYQHDVNQKELAGTLDTVIESAVNHVGVELNTASIELLKHVAGINATVAKNIVTYRNENGSFKTRKELLKVARLGPAAFTQCAGFLRLGNGKSPLDNTPVHPESYALAENILQELGFTLSDLADKKQLELLAAKQKLADIEQLAAKLDAGIPTVRDILDALTKPGRDPREDLPAPLTRKSLVQLNDLQIGTVVRGTVRNITDFGVFVDIGIKTAGLIHRSELSWQRIKHPLDVVSVGDIIDTIIISLDVERHRIGLSLKQVPVES